MVCWAGGRCGISIVLARGANGPVVHSVSAQQQSVNIFAYTDSWVDWLCGWLRPNGNTGGLHTNAAVGRITKLRCLFSIFIYSDLILLAMSNRTLFIHRVLQVQILVTNEIYYSLTHLSWIPQQKTSLARRTFPNRLSAWLCKHCVEVVLQSHCSLRGCWNINWLDLIKTNKWLLHRGCTLWMIP